MLRQLAGAGDRHSVPGEVAVVLRQHRSVQSGPGAMLDVRRGHAEHHRPPDPQLFDAEQVPVQWTGDGRQIGHTDGRLYGSAAQRLGVEDLREELGRYCDRAGRGKYIYIYIRTYNMHKKQHKIITLQLILVFFKFLLTDIIL